MEESHHPRPQQRDHPPPSQPLSEDLKPPTYPEHHIPPPTSIKREKSDQPNRRRTISANTSMMSKVLSVLIAGNGDTSAQLVRIETSIVSDTPNLLNQQSPDCHLFSPWVPLGKHRSVSSSTVGQISQ